MMVALFEFDHFTLATNHSCHAVNGPMSDVATGTVTMDICGPFLRVDGRASTVRDLIVAASTQSDVKRILVEDV